MITYVWIYMILIRKEEISLNMVVFCYFFGAQSWYMSRTPFPWHQYSVVPLNFSAFQFISVL